MEDHKGQTKFDFKFESGRQTGFILSNNRVRVMVFNAILKQYFSYIVMVSFIGGGNQSTC
jgi:hypothetical protein